MSIVGVLYGVVHVPPRKVGGHVTKYMKITTHRLTCTASRVLTRGFDPPCVNTATRTFVWEKAEGKGSVTALSFRTAVSALSNSHGARPVHLIITMIQWIRTSRLSIKSSLSLCFVLQL